MFAKILIAFLLMSSCVLVHALGTIASLRWVQRRAAGPAMGFLRSTRMLVGLASWNILLHLVEVAGWGVFYERTGGMPDIHSALYFSAVTYTTTGYGDLVLPDAWRMVGAVEALTGILMCGWSAAFFFAVASRLQQGRPTPERT